MTERPILFSGPMVRAILEGRKTQTRRIVKPQPESNTRAYINGIERDWNRWWPVGRNDYTGDAVMCPHGHVGDRLWVRETGWQRPPRTPRMMRDGADTWEPFYFDADSLSEGDIEDFKAWGFKRCPSIFMPRWASRIALEITGVRVEQLQNVSEADAIAEGLEKNHNNYWWGGPHSESGRKQHADPRLAYRELWDQINAKRTPWAANPWVWVIEFKRLQ